MDNTPDLGKAVSSFTKLQGLGRNVAGFPRPHTTQPVSLGLTASLPFLGSTPDFVSPGTGQGLRGICRRHQTRRGSEKPGQRQRTGEETQPGSLAPPPGWDREGLHREQEEVQRPGPVQDTHPKGTVLTASLRTLFHRKDIYCDHFTACQLLFKLLPHGSKARGCFPLRNPCLLPLQVPQPLTSSSIQIKHVACHLRPSSGSVRLAQAQSV